MWAVPTCRIFRSFWPWSKASQTVRVLNPMPSRSNLPAAQNRTERPLDPKALNPYPYLQQRYGLHSRHFRFRLLWHLPGRQSRSCLVGTATGRLNHLSGPLIQEETSARRTAPKASGKADVWATRDHGTQTSREGESSTPKSMTNSEFRVRGMTPSSWQTEDFLAAAET